MLERKGTIHIDYCDPCHFHRMKDFIGNVEFLYSPTHIEERTRTELMFQMNGVRHDIIPISNEEFQVIRDYNPHNYISTDVSFNKLLFLTLTGSQDFTSSALSRKQLLFFPFMQWRHWNGNKHGNLSFLWNSPGGFSHTISIRHI